MKARAPLMAKPSLTRQETWTAPMHNDGVGKHRRYIWIKRGGNNGTGGSGATGYKTSPARKLAEALCERVGVNSAVSRRQAERIAALARPPRPWGGFWGLDKDGNKTGVAA